MMDLTQAVIASHGRVNLVINCAGFGLHGWCGQVSIEEFAGVMDTNFWGVVYGSLFFLPHLLEQNPSFIVNVSSVHGLFGQAGFAPYCASKFAVRGFTQSLTQELRHTSCHAICVYPGGIEGSFQRKMRWSEGVTERSDPEIIQENFNRDMAKCTPDQAADVILRGIEKRKDSIIVGPDAHFYSLATRLLPGRWTHRLGRLQRRSLKQRLISVLERL